MTHSEKSSMVFITELTYLKEEAFKFITENFQHKLQLKGDKENGFPEVQYFLTVPGVFCGCSL